MLSRMTPARRKSLLMTWRLQLVFMGFTLVPLVLVGAVTVSYLRDAYQERVTDHLTVLVGKHSKHIDSFLADRLGNIRVLARSYTIADLSAEPFLQEQLAILREEYGGVFVDLGVIDPDGVQQTYTGPFNLSKANYAGTTWFSEVQKRGDFISDVFTGLRGKPHFIVAVTKPHQGRNWVVRATIDFDAFSTLVANIRLGRTGFAVIMNRSGEFQTQPQRDLIVSRGPYQDFLERKLDTNTALIEQRTDAFGHEAFFAVASLNAGRWLLCYQQRSSDALAALNLAVRYSLYWLVACGVLVNVIAFSFIRRAARRYARTDTEKEIMRNEVVEAGRLASIGELAAGIAHEINNPVAIMVEEAGWIQDILGDEDATSDDNLKEISRAVAQIKTQGGRCKEITHKLLSFARKTDSAIRETQLNDLIEEVVGILGQRTRYANIQVLTVLDNELPTVAGSATELQQVLLNLFNNAVDAMERSSGGGTLTITTEAENSHLTLAVGDTGVGIAKANLARIFDPFYTTKPVGHGTGLGLSICYGIVKKMGGDIKVESEKGKGTTFTIRLPAASGAELTDTPVPSATAEAEAYRDSVRPPGDST